MEIYPLCHESRLCRSRDSAGQTGLPPSPALHQTACERIRCVSCDPDIGLAMEEMGIKGRQFALQLGVR